MNKLLDEYLFIEIIQYLDYKNLSEVCLLNKSSKSLYNKYYYFLWSSLIESNKNIKFIKYDNQSTIKHKSYGISYSNNMDIKEIFNIFVNSLKRKNIEI